MNEMKLFVWESVFWDWGPGIAVAFATSVDEARSMLNPDNKAWIAFEIKDEPTVYTTPHAFYRTGSA